ncbi:hypothetical protein TCA2_4401 [Paenibacillus sp. TCA20]|uniref:hypothetical protein n=1 Tax=Paenibacillus sp. TCA20 TaxID=1499968 RepID=UPI0004DA6EC3|nr:hypothetical protein [Paenibacillus sp. TCA20]GAK41909.1 hypothetical protein TCA2_4401 [Paenibacillus sp. TCA20]
MSKPEIRLRNGKLATYKSSRQTRIPDMGINELTEVHSFRIPCPVCDHDEDNIAVSQDGIVFLNSQIVCRFCGVFFRPVVDPVFIKEQRMVRSIIS